LYRVNIRVMEVRVMAQRVGFEALHYFYFITSTSTGSITRDPTYGDGDDGVYTRLNFYSNIRAFNPTASQTKSATKVSILEPLM